LLRVKYPDIRPQGFDSISKALTALSNGKIDGFVDAIATSGYYMRQLGLDNLHIAGHFPDQISLSIGVHPSQPELLTILEKSLSAMPEHKLHGITKHWIDVVSAPRVDYFILWRAGGIVLGGISIFLLFYYRLRRANKHLAEEVSHRRSAEASMRELNNELIAKNLQLEELSRTDVLTGLRNRYYVESTLKSRFLTVAPSSLI